MDALREFIVSHPLLAASLSSLWGAIVIDLVAFTKAKEPGNWWGQFSVQVAVGRYIQAFIGGFVGNVALAGGIGLAGVALMWVW